MFGFSSQFSVIGLRSFSPAIWSFFKTHQLLYGARMFSLVSRFSSPFSQWVGRFFTIPHSYLYLHLHVRRSSCLRGKAIVMSWFADFGLHIIQSRLNLVFLATVMNSSLYHYNLIISITYYRLYVLILLSSYHACQPCHPHPHRTSPPNRLEIRVAMIPADQTDEACRLNTVRDLGHHPTQADYKW